MNIKLSSKDIINLLPHKYPMLFIDKVTYWKTNRLSALKMLTINERMFQGHFPGRPILPGIYMIEMAAQAAAIMYILDSVNPNSIDDFYNKINKSNKDISDMVGYLGSVKNVKFQNLATPGDEINIHVKETVSSNNLSEVSFKLTNQDRKPICLGRITVTKNGNNC